MTDGNRLYPVNKLVMHHSTGPEFYNASDETVQRWFSVIGKARGYQNGAINPYHTFPGSTEPSYAQAHYALIRYDLDGNKYGFRLVQLIDDPFNNVAWHAGDWLINQQSIGIEVAGNFLDHQLDQKALMLVADFWRPQDQALGGATLTYYHGQITPTACPGQIQNQINDLVDMQNNPDKWNNILFPAPPPPPPVDTRPEWQKNLVDQVDFKAYAQKNGATLINLETGATIKSFPPNTVFDISAETNVGGKHYFISVYSHSKGQPNGIAVEELGPELKPEPVPTPPPVDPKPDPVPPVTQPDWGEKNNILLQAILGIVNAIKSILDSVFKIGGK